MCYCVSFTMKESPNYYYEYVYPFFVPVSFASKSNDVFVIFKGGLIIFIGIPSVSVLIPWNNRCPHVFISKFKCGKNSGMKIFS